jgi:phospholipase/carboxylesterase
MGRLVLCPIRTPPRTFRPSTIHSTHPTPRTRRTRASACSKAVRMLATETTRKCAASSGSKRTAISRSHSLVLAVVIVLLAGCAGTAEREPSLLADIADSRLRLEARPRPDAKPCAPGEYELRVAPGRRTLMRVTPRRRGRSPALLVALHGAGSGGAPGGLYAFRGAWNLPGLVIVAPAAAGSAWTLGETDVHFVDRALQQVFARCRVDSQRVAVGGFSSGAGMALWLGLANGDLFRGVIALSGGGSLPDQRVGKPRVFVAHGTRDQVIPIALGGDEIVRELRSDGGYVVTYRRFDGGHRVVPAIARAAVMTTLVR